MKLVLLTIISILLFQKIASEGFEQCEEANNTFVLSFLYYLSEPQKCTDVKFYLGVKHDNDSLLTGNGNWSALTSEHFNPSYKTYFIVHGYRSHYQKTWIRDLKDKLLENRKINLFIVDWNKGANKWNYINSVLFAKQIKYKIAGFLNNLKKEVKKAYKSTEGEWKNLYFIGHSLGAHVSGQTAHLIRTSGKGFYKVERITGLDPAQPCFTKPDHTFKLDKNDADFVDVIHTQTGTGEGISGFGIKENLGHIDFYVNGGVHQADCLNSTWTTELNRMICSHKIACRYFIESIGSSDSPDCKFVGHKWNNTFVDALRIVKEVESGDTCTDCPQMGIGTSKTDGSGSYLVLTPSKQPHCSAYEDHQLVKLKKAVNRLNETRTSVFTGNPDSVDLFSNFE